MAMTPVFEPVGSLDADAGSALGSDRGYLGKPTAAL